MANKKLYPTPTTTGVVNPMPDTSVTNPFAGSTQTGLYQAKANQPVQIPMQTVDTSGYGGVTNDQFMNTNVSPSLTDFQNQQANANNWSYEKAITTPTTQDGLYKQQLSEGRKLENELLQGQVNDLNSFDWLGAGSLAFQGADTLMQMGLYGDRKDYMQNVNAGLEQNMRNAQATHDNRATQQQNLGSTFSRNS